MSDLSQISTDDLLKMLQQHAPQSPAQIQQKIMGDPITQGALHPESDSAVENLAAGVGRGLTRLGQGVSQGLGFGPSREQMAENEQRDVPLMATKAGFAGDIIGTAAPAAIASLLPGGQSYAGQALIGGSMGFAQPLESKDQSRTLNTVIGAVMAPAVKYGMEKLSGLVAKSAAEKANEVVSHNARAQQLSKVLQEGREAGFVIPPSQANPSATNRIIESIGGKAATQQQASQINQDAAYAIAQRTAGLSPEQALTEANLKAARTAAAAPYRAVANLNPQANAELEAWRAANLESKLQWGHFNKQGSPDAYHAAKAADAAANTALTNIENMAQKAGKPDLVASLRNARVQIAKIHTVDRAVEGSSFNPADLAKQADRGAKISGELGTIVRMYQDFPKAMKAPQQGGSVGVNQLMPWLGGGGGGALGAAVAGAPGAAAGSLAGMAATQAVPPLARALMLSKPYQGSMANVPQLAMPMALRLSQALRSRAAQALVPPAAALMSVEGAQ